MRESREFYISDDGIRLHLKLDFPQENSDENSDESCGKSGGESFGEGCLALPSETNRTEKTEKAEEIKKTEGAEKAEKLPLMILVHGFTGDMEETHIRAVQRTANEEGFAVLRAEMYGHGKSGGSFGDHTLMKWISNILTVIDYARSLDFVSDLYLCGHSQGGLLTMLAGAMERDRLKAILPLSPASMIPEIARQGEILGVPFDLDHIPAELDAGKSLTLRENYIRVAQLIDVDLAIARYNGPVLIVHGTGDESVPYHYSEKAAAKYANARLVPIPGDTHCYDLHLDQVTEAVRAFLREMK